MKEETQFDDKILAQLAALSSKFEASGQNLSSYLDGLLHAKYLNYSDYIQLETLLSLQRPRTNEPDEFIFIIYHQITELYFKLINWELKQISTKKNISADFLLEKVSRLNRYCENLIFSYDIMLKGMDEAQFLKFRMSLLPASGFQSFQFRLIEIYSTDLIQLVSHDLPKDLLANASLEQVFEQLYWKKGAQELATGKKTLTLLQFEEKYTRKLLRNAHQFFDKNLNQVVLKMKSQNLLNNDLIQALKDYDINLNVRWSQMHFKSASKFLSKKPVNIEATGGTNWHKYLPPRFQKKVFFPSLWTSEEIENWGK
jgi:tryptophan 2,3-dioxygenase